MQTLSYYIKTFYETTIVSCFSKKTSHMTFIFRNGHSWIAWIFSGYILALVTEKLFLRSKSVSENTCQFLRFNLGLGSFNLWKPLSSLNVPRKFNAMVLNYQRPLQVENVIFCPSFEWILTCQKPVFKS